MASMFRKGSCNRALGQLQAVSVLRNRRLFSYKQNSRINEIHVHTVYRFGHGPKFMFRVRVRVSVRIRARVRIREK